MADEKKCIVIGIFEYRNVSNYLVVKFEDDKYSCIYERTDKKTIESCMHYNTGIKVIGTCKERFKVGDTAIINNLPSNQFGNLDDVIKHYKTHHGIDDLSYKLSNNLAVKVAEPDIRNWLDI